VLSLRIIRFAKWTAWIVNAATTGCAILIVGWQVVIFMSDGSWQDLPLSLLFGKPEDDKGDIYSTASIDKIASTAPDFVGMLLQIPIIVILVLAVILLSAFYLWLSAIEKAARARYT